MGNRRMFSLKIINSARFIKMPIDAQNLYFHLGMRADDDGIVEAFSVMRLIGSTEDNLKILHAKSFVHILNEDLVTYISDWTEHNTIRSDRKIDSLYKDLIVKILPDIKLIEAKPRADRKKGQPTDANGTSQGQPMDGLSKGKLSKGKLSKGKLSSTTITAESFYNNNIDLIKPFIAEQIQYYLQDGVEEALILHFMQYAVKQGKRSWNYIEACLKENLNKGIKTIASYEIAEAERSNKKSSTTQPKKSKGDNVRDYLNHLRESGEVIK